MDIVQKIKSLSDKDLKQIILDLKTVNIGDDSTFKKMLRENQKEKRPITNMDMVLELYKESANRWAINPFTNQITE